MFTTIFLLLLCYALIYVGIYHGYYSALLLAPLASGLSVRTFVLQHDFGHGSLFRAAWANNWAGRLCSVLTLTPYDHWRRHHGIHHGSWNNIANRGKMSNIYSDCITVAEYRAMSTRQKLSYRIANQPFLSMFIMPPIIFFLVYRYPFDTPKGWWRERLGVHLTNLTILLIYAAIGHAVGYATMLMVSLLVIYPASVFGIWLFLVQHKFEGVHWEADANWNSFDAALTGCSLFKLPRVLQWFSASIGYHHVHHAAPGIPNYRLEECHHANPVFHDVKTLGLRDSWAEVWSHRLWDEDAGRMVDFHTLGAPRPASSGA
nr:fatty acid desaturase [Gluconacetobacter tumulisoli]